MWLVLTFNMFEWKGKQFAQKTGTAIGTRSAPTFADLFMGMLEKIMLEAWENRKPITIPKEWWRFIDDILFWWTGTEEELKIFLNFINEFHPTMKFTWNYNFETRQVEFLDMLIWDIISTYGR